MTTTSVTTGRRFAPELERLPDRVTPTSLRRVPEFVQLVTPDDGGKPVVQLLDRRTGEQSELQAYDSSFLGGVRAATGDVTGDGIADVVTAAGAGGGPHVKVFDGRTGAEVRSFFAYDPAFTGGVELAVGDVNRDGFADVVTAAGAGGGPHVKVFDGKTMAEAQSFFAFDDRFRGGVFVSAADVNRDGFADLLVGAGAGGGPHAKVFDGRTMAEVKSFFAFEPSFRGGVRVAAGDLNADGFADVVTAAGPGGGPHVKAVDGRSGALLSNRFVTDVSFAGGVRVATTPELTGGRDAVVAVTRSGDLARSVAYPLTPDSFDSPFDTWVGVATPSSDQTFRTSLLTPPLAGTENPIRVLDGTVGGLSDDGRTLTLLRGAGGVVTVNLAGDPPSPAGTVNTDTRRVRPAAVWAGEQPATLAALRAGDWVRLQVARGWDLSATEFTAISVRLL